MTEPVEKGRRRSSRAYIRPDRFASPEDLERYLEVIARYYPADEDGDQAVLVAKPKPRARRAAKPAAAKRKRAKELQVPDPSEKSYFGEPLPGDQYASRRVSEPLSAGQASPARDDHGVGQGRNPGLAAHHGDLRQSSPAAFDAVTRLMSVLGDNEHGDRSITQTVGEVGLRMFNARGQAGTYGGMQPVNPSPLRPDYGMARNSATPPNGTHSLGNPSCPPTGAMKASDRVAIMRRAMFPGSGGAR